MMMYYGIVVHSIELLFQMKSVMNHGIRLSFSSELWVAVNYPRVLSSI